MVEMPTNHAGPVLASLEELGDLLNGPRGFRETSDVFLRMLSDRLDLERAAVLLLDEIGSVLRVASAPELPLEVRSRAIWPVGQSSIAGVVATGEPRVITTAEATPDLDPWFDSGAGGTGTDALICVPIKPGGRTLGVLAARRRRPDPATIERDRQCLAVAAGIVAQAVQLQRMIRRDKQQLVKEVTHARGEDTPIPQYENVVGSSPAMIEVFRTIERIATTRATILLVGETGTGKEVIAKVIHSRSTHEHTPFVAVNCSALPGQLLESELFGHVHGAFTGAIRDKIGRFEAADGGTLLLDEISTIELPLQVKLLRVLQEREIERVGDVRSIPVDVRIIAATNQDLAEAVKSKRFREDLFYRLNVVVIHIPALRERREDIPRLVDHFLDKFNAANKRNLQRMSEELMSLFVRYPWPGNVRELENTVERAVVLSEGEDFSEDLLPPSLRAFAAESGSPVCTDNTDEIVDEVVRRSVEESAGTEGEVWDRVFTRVERSLIREALDRCGQVKIKAADFLGINRNTLNKKCRELGLLTSAREDTGGNDECRSTNDEGMTKPE